MMNDQLKGIKDLEQIRKKVVRRHTTNNSYILTNSRERYPHYVKISITLFENFYINRLFKMNP